MKFVIAIWKRLAILTLVLVASNYILLTPFAMAVNTHKLFDEDLPAYIAKNPDSVREIGGKVNFIITGQEGGEWFIDASDSGADVRPAKSGDNPDIIVTISNEDFQKYYENPLANGTQLFFAGKIRVVGNQLLFLKLSKLFQVDNN